MTDAATSLARCLDGMMDAPGPASELAALAARALADARPDRRPMMGRSAGAYAEALRERLRTWWAGRPEDDLIRVSIRDGAEDDVPAMLPACLPLGFYFHDDVAKVVTYSIETMTLANRNLMATCSGVSLAVAASLAARGEPVGTWVGEIFPVVRGIEPEFESVLRRAMDLAVGEAPIADGELPPDKASGCVGLALAACIRYQNAPGRALDETREMAFVGPIVGGLLRSRGPGEPSVGSASLARAAFGPEKGD